MFKQSRSLAGRIKGLRYAVRLNDFKLAQRFRMGLAVTFVISLSHYAMTLRGWLMSAVYGYSS